MANIEQLGTGERFRVHRRLASADEQRCRHELVDNADIVVHLAAAVGVSLIVEKPVRTIETNVHCTEVVLAHADDRKPVLIASTTEVYGKSDALPFRRGWRSATGRRPTRRAGPTPARRRSTSSWRMAYWRERGLPITVVRLFNTVGPRQTGRYGMVVPRSSARRWPASR